MKEMIIKDDNIKFYSESKYEIAYSTDGAAGLDLPYYDCKKHWNLDKLPKWLRWFKERKLILPFIRYKLPTGIYVEMNSNEYGEIDSRSSTSKKKLIPLCRTIDHDYRGNIHCVFMRVALTPCFIKVGECRFQMVMKPYVKKRNVARVSEKSMLSKTVRGENGFGHTDGIKK